MECEDPGLFRLYTFDKFKEMAKSEGVPVDDEKWWNKYKDYVKELQDQNYKNCMANIENGKIKKYSKTKRG